MHTFCSAHDLANETVPIPLLGNHVLLIFKMQNVLITVYHSLRAKRCSLKMMRMVFQQHETALLLVIKVERSSLQYKQPRRAC